jgi:SAM-dependent methyltransferase
MNLFNHTQYLQENCLLPPDPCCPLCGSQNRFPIGTIQRNPLVTLLECRTCYACSVSRMPSLQASERYYQGYYGKPKGLPDEGRITFDQPERLAKYLVAKTVRSLQSRPVIRILDFGGGDGTIALKTAECFLMQGIAYVSVTVADVNETIVSSNDKRITLTKANNLHELSDNDYDLIIASAILEHIPNPKQSFLSLSGLLSDGGHIYIRTPFFSPFIKFFNCFGIQWDFSFPAHLHDFGPVFWKNFLVCLSKEGKANFEVITSKPPLIETVWELHFFKTLAAFYFRAPFYLLGSRYKFVGSWETILKRIK